MKTATRVWLDDQGHGLIEHDDGTLLCETCGDTYKADGMGDLAREVCVSGAVINDEHNWDEYYGVCRRCGAPMPDPDSTKD